MKKNLETQLEYLNSTIDLTDFNTIERGLKYHLRFELGDPFKNGTKKRVNRATKRATELFENYIDRNSNVYLIIYDFIDDLFARTPNHIYSLLESKDIISSKFEENLALRYFSNADEIERTKGKLSIYFANRDKVQYSAIFNGIANTEMGFSPTIHQLVYFFQPESKKWFWMYDDRGCLMFSEESSDLKPKLERYSTWVVESQRTEMENQFE